LIRDRSRRSRGAVVFEDRVADRYALVTNVCPGIVAWRRDQFRDRVLRLVAERTAQHLIRTRSGFHSALLLFWWPSRGWLPCFGLDAASRVSTLLLLKTALYLVL